MDAPRPTVTSDQGEPNFIFLWFCERPTVVLSRERALTGSIDTRQTDTKAPARRKRKSHREIKRASHGKWLGRRVRNDVNFGARWFPLCGASL